MSELGISPSKALGQNFLVSQSVIDQIVSYASNLPVKHWVEIGPGLGALTDHLKSRCEDLQLIELDREIAQYWRDQGCRVTEADALKLDWGHLNLEGRSCLVSNLPYQISSSLVIERSVESFGITDMVLMFQKEVAQRIMAKPKTPEYGLLSVIAQRHWEVGKLCEAGPKDFYPPPKVASRVLHFRRKEELPQSSKDYLSFVKQAFSQRRKMLAKNIKPYVAKSSEEIKKVFLELGHSEGIRAEELSPMQLEELLLKFQ